MKPRPKKPVRKPLTAREKAKNFIRLEKVSIKRAARLNKKLGMKMDNRNNAWYAPGIRGEDALASIKICSS